MYLGQVQGLAFHLHHPPPLLSHLGPPATHRFPPLMCKKHGASLTHAHCGGTPQCAPPVHACMRGALQVLSADAHTRPTCMRGRGRLCCMHAPKNALADLNAVMEACMHACKPAGDGPETPPTAPPTAPGQPETRKGASKDSRALPLPPTRIAFPPSLPASKFVSELWTFYADRTRACAPCFVRTVSDTSTDQSKSKTPPL